MQSLQFVVTERRFVNIKDSKNVLVTVKPGTSEIFLECYCVARKKPIRREKPRLLGGTVTSLSFCD